MILPDPSNPDCLVIIHAPRQGLVSQTYRLSCDGPPITVGRRADSTIVLDDEGTSRQHARFERRAGEWWVTDCGSTNGTFVNSAPVTSVQLRSGDTIRIGRTFFRADVTYPHEEHHYPTPIDGLTKAYNRRFFRAQLDAELPPPAGAPAPPLSLVMVDLDHFKRLNDEHGHLVGDRVIEQIASLAQIYAGPGGLTVRYGGEEFALLLRGVDRPGAAALAEMLRAEVAARPLCIDDQTIAVTLSAGVAQVDDRTRTGHALIARADERLYEAKRAGRNRVVA